MVVVLRTRIVQRTATAIWLTKGSLACATAPWFLQEKVRSIQFDSYTCMYTCMYVCISYIIAIVEGEKVL